MLQIIFAASTKRPSTSGNSKQHLFHHFGGTPHGSVLRPFLFLNCTSDLSKVILDLNAGYTKCYHSSEIDHNDYIDLKLCITDGRLTIFDKMCNYR